MKTLDLKMIAVLLAVLILAYFLAVTSFFNGWQNADLIGDGSDMLFAFISFMIIPFATRIKIKSTRTMLMLGSFFIGIDRIIQIILREQEHLTGSQLEAFYWIPLLILCFIGMLLIIYSLREMVK